MRHPTYKHLEARLRVGAFSVGRWCQIAAAGAGAAIFGAYVSPLPAEPTIFISIVGAGLPVAVSYGATGLEFSVAQLISAGWRYWRAPHRYLPGPGAASAGYLVRADHAIASPPAPDPGLHDGDLLWDA